jgi:HPt (histidine-containing phosphotransfer) domain-containing protein
MDPLGSGQTISLSAMSADAGPEFESRRGGSLQTLLVLAAGGCGGFALAVLSPALWEHHGRLAGVVASALACCLLAAAALMSLIGKARPTLPAAGASAKAPVRAAPSKPRPAREHQAEPSGPVLDEDALGALLRLGDEAFVAEVAAQFAAEGTLVLLKIARAVSDGDAAEFASQTHALRSSAANVGARRLYRLCLQWRDIPADELTVSGSAKFILLQKEFDAAQRALRAWQECRGMNVTPAVRLG